jgi:hypothetical protein
MWPQRSGTPNPKITAQVEQPRSRDRPVHSLRKNIPASLISRPPNMRIKLIILPRHGERKKKKKEFPRARNPSPTQTAAPETLHYIYATGTLPRFLQSSYHHRLCSSPCFPPPQLTLLLSLCSALSPLQLEKKKTWSGCAGNASARAPSARSTWPSTGPRAVPSR